MKTFLLRTSLVMLMTMLLTGAFAKSWRVNKTAGINADFYELSSVQTSSAVANGDTIYVEGSVNTHTAFTLTKKLIFIGPGYFLAGAGSNPGLQANTATASVNIYIDSLASGSQFMGLDGYLYPDNRTDDLYITRCNVGVYSNAVFANGVMTGLRVTQCYLNFSLSNSYRLDNFQVLNCILKSATFPNSNNGLIRNNVLYATTLTVSNSYISNNIFSSSGMTAVNCTVRYNMATNNILPAGNNNQNNVPVGNIFITTTSSDDYSLKAGSPAIGAGEPIGGITPDLGIFGTADPYRLSGIPAVPSIYLLTVPASVPTSASTMAVTVSTRSNN